MFIEGLDVLIELHGEVREIVIENGYPTILFYWQFWLCKTDLICFIAGYCSRQFCHIFSFLALAACDVTLLLRTVLFHYNLSRIILFWMFHSQQSYHLIAG